MPFRHQLVCLALPAIAILAAHFAGGWIALGAHPWWSLSGAATGIAIGFAAMALLLLARRFGAISLLLLVLVFAALALVAAILMFTGKEGFALSYAQDAAAGRYWHYGFIGLAAALYAALAAGTEAALTRHN